MTKSEKNLKPKAKPKAKKKAEPKIRQQRIENWLRADKKKQIQEWLSHGISETQLAHNMGISRQTLWKWKADSEALANVIQEGKVVADTQVVNSLFNRTQGYYYTETTERPNIESGELEVVERKTKYLPPDMGAITFWLKNRMAEEWKDKVELEEDDTKNEVIIRFEGGDEYAN